MGDRKSKKLDDTVELGKIYDIKTKKTVKQPSANRKNVSPPKTAAGKKTNMGRSAANPGKRSGQIKMKGKPAVTKKRKRRQKRILRVFMLLIIAIGIIAAGITLAGRAIFKIDTITVVYNGKTQTAAQPPEPESTASAEDDNNVYIEDDEQDSAQTDVQRYDNASIIKQSLISVGNNLISADLKRAKENIEMNLPYIGTAELKRKLPDTIVITVEETTVKYAYTFGMSYALVNENGKVLEISDDISAQDCTEIKGAAVKLAEAGNKISFESADKKYQEKIDAFLKAYENSELEPITYIDFSDINDVYMNYDGRIRIHVGAGDDLERKFKLAVKTLETEDQSSPEQTGELNLTIPKKAYFSADK